MFYSKKVMVSLGLQIELPMLIQCDNKGGGLSERTFNWRILRVREHKDNGVIKVEWIRTESNDADIGTKNSGRAGFDKYFKRYVGCDEYHSPPQSKGG